MTIELTPQECEVLIQVVERELHEMVTEIRHTDNREFRDELKTEREVLRLLLDRLGHLAA